MPSETEPTLRTASSPTAAYVVNCAGTKMTQQDPKGLETLVVETHLDKIGRADLLIKPEAESPPSGLTLGADVDVSIGGSDKKAFQGKITHLTHVHENGTDMVRVVAMDPLIKLAASNETVVYEEQKDSDIASSVLGGDAGTVDATSATHAYVLQRAESNLRFVKRLAARNGYLVYAEEGKIHFKKPQVSDTPKDISPGDLISLETTISDVGIPQTVKVFGWDYVVEGESASSGVDKIGGGDAPSSVTWTADHDIVDVFVKDPAVATDIAKGVMNQMARQYVQGKVTVNSNGELFPGQRIKLAGQFEGFNADAYVVGVRHVVEQGSVATTTAWFVSNTKPE